jgi:hypothetical protein
MMCPLLDPSLLRQLVININENMMPFAWRCYNVPVVQHNTRGTSPCKEMLNSWPLGDNIILFACLYNMPRKACCVPSLVIGDYWWTKVLYACMHDVKIQDIHICKLT